MEGTLRMTIYKIFWKEQGKEKHYTAMTKEDRDDTIRRLSIDGFNCRWEEINNEL